MLAQKINVAINAVRKATRLAEKIAQSLDQHGSMTKSDLSPVTIADYAVQAMIHRDLNQHVPGDLIVAEEDTIHLEDAGNAAMLSRLLSALEGEGDEDWTHQAIIEHVERGTYSGGANGCFWTLDPIDGTKGFLRGDQYAVALALIEDGRPVLGVLGCPRLVLPAEGAECKGWICWADGEHAVAESITGSHSITLHASRVASTAQIRMCESVESGHSAHGKSRKIADALKISRQPLRMDSQVKYAAVASGIADAYLRLPTRGDYQEKIWDHAAGAILVQSAGGQVSDISGKPLNFGCGRTLMNNRGIVATSAGIHQAVLDAVRMHVT